MGLFAKQPIRLSQDLPYTITLATKIKMIIGLGNPGSEYDLTRHNIGFMVLDHFAENNNFGKWQISKKFKASICETNLGDTKVILLKPNTFMNLSGESAQLVAHFYDMASDQIIAVHDELSIPFGQIRTRVGGQSAGHNGIKSLIQHLGPDFGRVRIGIKNEISAKAEDSEFVLGKFNKKEQELLPELLVEASSILTEYVYGGQLPHDTRKIMTD